jgi:signal transduction histidine kinase/ActR/RegA family two-component response regulator
MSSSTQEEKFSDEICSLRRTMRDLVALSALPAIWTGYNSARIAESLADVMLSTLSLESICVTFSRCDATDVTEVARCRQVPDSTENREKVAQALRCLLKDPFASTSVIPHPLQEGTLRVASARFGYAGDTGMLVAGSSRSNFPTEQERLLISVAANQAAISIQQKRVEEERLVLLEREREAHEKVQKEVAERKRAAESERAARMEAERASRLRDEFLATVSHELRTPLNSVLGWVQVLRRSPRQEEVRAQGLDAIERGARAQTRLIADLLDMSRIISGKLRLEVQTIELTPLLQAAIETLRPGAEAKTIRIEHVLDPLAGPIKGDPARLQQIFCNLLSNAVKFTPKGGKIQVHLERIDSHIEISVSDNGQGIAPEFLPSVFDRFSQADGCRRPSYGGLGLGLAIVRHLVELHGGKVWAASPGEGKGSTFSVHLPIAIVHQYPFGRELPLSSARIDYCEVFSDVNLSNVRVLVVDDDTDACEMRQRVLAEYKATVDTATSVSQALERLDQTVYDIIISDIGMPEIDGYKFIRQLRSRGATIPAVAVTAFARSEDRILALQAGYNMHISKPLEPMELIAVIAALVPQRSSKGRPFGHSH